jgi:hypothetical protein
MDNHHVTDPVNPLIEVPYICLKEYDNRGFFDYPIRQGRALPVVSDTGQISWSDPGEELSLEEQVSTPLTEANAPLLHTWLYFSSLSEILGVPINSKDFIC